MRSKIAILESGTKIKVYNVPDTIKKGEKCSIYFTEFVFRTNRWEYTNQKKDKVKICKIIE